MQKGAEGSFAPLCMAIMVLMKKILLLLSLLLVVGCVSSSGSAFVSPEGESIYYTKCNVSEEGCLKDIAENCPSGYNTINTETHMGGILADLIPGPVRWWSITYSCKEEETKSQP